MKVEVEFEEEPRGDIFFPVQGTDSVVRLTNQETARRAAEALLARHGLEPRSAGDEPVLRLERQGEPSWQA